MHVLIAKQNCRIFRRTNQALELFTILITIYRLIFQLVFNL